MEELSFDNILGENEIENLFVGPDDTTPAEEEEEVIEATTPKEENKEKKNTTEVINPDDLFTEDNTPESVGSGKNKEGNREDTVTDKDSEGTSPNDNFYSSFANALVVDGIFLNLDEETVKKAVDAESFSELMEAEINARLDEKQQRISKALENGVEPNEIKKYEGALNYINNISPAALAEESEKGEKLRYNLIYQDYLNKGMSPDKAKKLTDRSVDAGTDIEDAKDALVSNKEYFSTAYNDLLQEAQQQADAEVAARKEEAKKLENSIMKDKQVLGDIEVDNNLRKKAFDSISKPIYKDPETGQYMTAIQKYESEHRTDFLKYTGLIFAMTNGFKDFDTFVKGKVKKEVKKGLRDLEKTLNNTRRDSNGTLRLVTNQKDDPNSFINQGLRLDI